MNENGERYYYINGVLQKGQQNINGSWYLFNRTTGVMMYGQQKDSNGQWYLFDRSSGIMRKGQVNDAGNWYLFDRSSGIMRKGQVNDAGNWYLFNRSSGIMMYGLQTDINGKTYYFNNAGKMSVGWKNINNRMQYFSINSGILTRIFSPVLFHQNDSRWANTQVGDSTLAPEGCGPTSITMILNGYGTSVTPPTVARVANHVGTYNKYNPAYPGADGIDGLTLLSTLDYYDLGYKNVTTESQLITELKLGKPVIYGMEWLYSYPNISHFVVLFGYQKGYTTIYDPLGKLTGLQSVDKLWKHPSQLPDDHDAGFPLWSVVPK
nr:C39 family peptidase [Lactococcus lactis]